MKVNKNLTESSKDDEKKEEPRKEFVIESPPTHYIEEVSLEERVEALEAKVDEEKPFQRGDL